MTSRSQSGEIPIGPVLEALGIDKLPEPGEWGPVNCVNPKHPDQNASAGTNGFGYRCHGCGLKGDAIRIVMEVKQIDRSSAKRFIESVLGGSIPEVPRRPTGDEGRRVFGGRSRSKPGNNRKVQARIRKRPTSGT